MYLTLAAEFDSNNKERIKKAENYIMKALQISEQIHDVKGIATNYFNLFQARKEAGDLKQAYEYYKKYLLAQDNIVNDENLKEQTRLEMQFEFGKKQTADSVKVAEEKKLAVAELNNEKNKSYALYGGLAILLLFAAFMYNRFLLTRKQKSIIENQKTELEYQKGLLDQKNKDIIDSIHYAQRIQRSLLPNEKYLNKIIKKS